MSLPCWATLMSTDREEAEAASELRNVCGSEVLLPRSASLADQAEEIKDSIHSFDVARISDIENERIPPEMVDASDVQGMEEFASQGKRSSTNKRPSHRRWVSTSAAATLGAPPLPSSPPSDATGGPLRRSRGRSSSLGTTMTSPSTRRRALEATAGLSMSLRLHLRVLSEMSDCASSQQSERRSQLGRL